MNHLAGCSEGADFFPIKSHVQSPGVAQGNLHLPSASPDCFFLGFEKDFELRLIVCLYPYPRLFAGLDPENMSALFLLLGWRDG